MTTTTLQVSDSTGDGYTTGDTWPGATTNVLTGDEIRLGGKGSTPYFCGTGFIFSANIPIGATIDSSFLSVCCRTAGSNSCNLTLFCNDVDNASLFGNTTDVTTGGPGFRTALTTGTVWNIGSTAWTAGSWYSSPDIKSDVQAVVNRSGRSTSFRLGVFAFLTSHTTPATDSRRYIYSQKYTGNVSGAKLDITYTVSGGAKLFHAHFQGQGIV